MSQSLLHLQDLFHRAKIMIHHKVTCGGTLRQLECASSPIVPETGDSCHRPFHKPNQQPKFENCIMFYVTLKFVFVANTNAMQGRKGKQTESCIANEVGPAFLSLQKHDENLQKNTRLLSVPQHIVPPRFRNTVLSFACL
eukprot:1796606-Rhodomonas_salina.1